MVYDFSYEIGDAGLTYSIKAESLEDAWKKLCEKLRGGGVIVTELNDSMKEIAWGRRGAVASCAVFYFDGTREATAADE